MPEQKRKHLRLPVESTTFIELVSHELGETKAGDIVMCKTLDISRSGLQVTTAQEMQLGAILQIGVDLPGSKDTLYLAGQIRWCKPNGSEQQPWTVGFQLLNADNSDIDRWEALLAVMES